MGGGESTNSSQSVSKPLTAAERQDLYRSSIGNILNTYTQSGLPYGGSGSMTNATNAAFDPYAAPGQPAQASGGWGGLSQAATGGGDLYNASGNSETYHKGGQVTFDPKTYFQTNDPSISMPTGARDPGGINMPVYQTPQYQTPGAFQEGGYTAGLDYAKAKDMAALDSNLAKRGIWSSGLAEKAIGDTNAAYSGAYEKAGADQATAQNAYNQQAAGNANTFNVTNANNSLAAGWKPLEYLNSLWNGTAGQTSGSSSFGQSLNFGIGK